jgi:uncharacterized protein (DUF2249 family)
MTANVVKLDVREDIRNGREPFTKIMSAIQSVASGDNLLLVAPFEPVPLYHFLRKKGFSYHSSQQTSGDWEVLFTREESVGSTRSEPTVSQNSRTGEVLEVDARRLEPPEPLIRILEALATLPSGAQLLAKTDRRPIHLYAQLEERGFSGETTEDREGGFLTLIREVMTNASVREVL